MKKLVLAALIIATCSSIGLAGDYIMAPDGTYVGGDSYTMAPDGTYVGGHGYTLAPDGSYVGVYDKTPGKDKPRTDD